MFFMKNSTTRIAVAGSLLVILIMVLGSIWTGQRARQDTEKAVHSVSLLYLDELAGRREQVVEGNLQGKINDIRIALSLLDEMDLSDEVHMQSYQARMKQIYNLEKFAFVDENGRIYTSLGQQNNIHDYDFDYQNLHGPEISVLNIHSTEKKVVIALPFDHLAFGGTRLKVCFMEINMKEMLQGVSVESQNSEATFCNIYTRDGIALSNTVLGGLAVENNLLQALSRAQYETGYSYDHVVSDFENMQRGIVSFAYDGVRETLSYVPVAGTDWMLTYLIRENVISQKISSISERIILRNILQSVLALLVLLAMFTFIMIQARKNARLTLEKETADAASRAKQEELETRLSLQGQLLEEEKRRTQQDQMITALASDYRSVYYIDLDHDDAVCYRHDPTDQQQHPEGEHFAYLSSFTWYANQVVDPKYREEFLKFITPEQIQEGLSKEPILAYRYLARRDGKKYYEMIRVAGVRHANERSDHKVHAIGLGLTVIDAEMRQDMSQKQALSDALSTAEQASKAKTAFLSNMSHEIRTPMNAIIGLDNIALNDPETPEKTKEYLLKINASAEHLLNLINDILDMSRIESGRMVLKNEEFSFSRLIETINTMFSSQCADKGLDYQCHIDGHVNTYYIGDNMKLRQVLINILGNAVKFTPQGGKVSLNIKETASFEGHSTLQFIISDTGIGMSPEFLPHIFDTFSQEDSSTTSKFGSSGLGMAITKNIVQMMNGQILVESEKGKGTTFTVSVTLTDAEKKDAPELDNINPQDMSVLIVDDDPVACAHARLVLEKAGISSEIADSGKKALEMVRLHQARMSPYNLILMDWKMPEMDGVETTRQIRSIVQNDSAIIILTAYKWDDVFQEALEAGVDTFLPKPLFADQVLEEFMNAAKRKSQARKEVSRADLKGRRILLAEDMEVNAEIMMMVLEMRDMTTELAVNGRIALEMFSSHPAGYYDAILMDMRMPEMDGLEATRRIRALDRPDAKTIPMIALTANAFDEDVQRSLQAGLNAHLSKPVQPEILFETLETLIRP